MPSVSNDTLAKIYLGQRRERYTGTGDCYTRVLQFTMLPQVSNVTPTHSELPSEIIGGSSFPPLARNKQQERSFNHADKWPPERAERGGIMFKQSAHQTEFRLEEEALYSNTTHVLIAILLGYLGVLLVSKSLLGRHCGGDDDIDKIIAEEAKEEEAAGKSCCVCCGITEGDGNKLIECNACDLVRYCSVKCQEEHRPQHEATCKERAAELRDEILFRQPENSHLGDCPICVLPLSNDQDEFSLQSCCSKFICNGCGFANLKRQQEKSLDFTCPFCRQKMSESVEVGNMNHVRRVAANDPVSTREMGVKHYNDGDFEGAIEYYTKAAELGNAEAHYDLSVLYREGKGVKKDEGKELYHLEEAAIGGHPDARYNIGLYETENRRFDRAVNHWIIAANLGHGDSIQKLKKCYTHGLVSKEGFAAALRAHQAAVDATKSPQREATAKAIAKAKSRGSRRTSEWQ